MTANTAPIFTRQPHVEWINGLKAANTAKDGTGTVDVLFTADATNGSYVQKITVVPLGTNVATVLRIFVENLGPNSVPANNGMIAQVTLPATTNTEVAALSAIEIRLEVPLPVGYRLFATLGTAVAAGFAVTAWGGDY